MKKEDLLKVICNGPVIPAARTFEDFRHALAKKSPSIIVLFGDILMLPEIANMAQEKHKRLLIHFDLFGGIGKDKAGIAYLARSSVYGIITTKSHLVKEARDAGMIAIQRLFLMDSDALKTGINIVRNYKPDAVEVLPGSVPASAVKAISSQIDIAIFAGGLISSTEDISMALSNGVSAISTSKRELWDYEYPYSTPILPGLR